MPMDALEIKKAALENLNTKYGELSSKVAALESAADALRESADFNVFSSTTTDSSILSATAAATASEGTYDIVVSQLAKAHKYIFTGVATAETVISDGTGVFEFTVAGGTTQSVTLTSTTTLQDLSDAINALSNGVVTASVVNDGDPTSPYRLILTADDTGDVNDILIGTDNTNGNLTGGATLQAAQDAAFTVDTLPITSASNSVTGVITGVTIDLLSADSGVTVTLNVKSDADTITAKVETLIAAYNDIVTYIKDNNRYNVDTKKAEPFFGDSISRSVRDDIRGVMMGEISGLVSSDITRLIHVGVSIDVNGKFSLDTADFKDALSTNFTDVRALFIEDTDNSTEGFASLLYDLAYDIDDIADGRIKGRRNGIADRLETISDSILHQEVQLEFYEVRIRNQFNALEMLLTGVRQQSTYLQGLVRY